MAMIPAYLLGLLSNYVQNIPIFHYLTIAKLKFKQVQRTVGLFVCGISAACFLLKEKKIV